MSATQELSIELAQASFPELYQVWVQPVYRYTLSRVGRVADAEDLTSQTFLSAYEKMHTLCNESPFAAWLFTIARNKIRDYYRKMNRKPQTDLENPEMLSADPASASLEELVWVRRLVERLPAHEQELIRLRYAAQLDFVTIAEILGKNAAAVRKFHYRLIQKLQKQMEVAHD